MKIKNIIIYIIVFIIIIASFKAPEILLATKINDIENQMFYKEKIKNSIDVEAEKIYLVKAIHDMENGNNAIEIATSNKKYSITGLVVENSNGNIVDEKSEGIIEELSKLIEQNILDTDITRIYTGSLVDRQYATNQNRYVLFDGYIEFEDKLFSVELESKTRKILFINFSKEDLYDKCSKEELLTNYVKYLDLYIIDDWHFENDMLKSDKASLIVNLAEAGERYILSVHGIEKISNTMIYTYSN